MIKTKKVSAQSTIREVADECLDWQNSQFINIVGKDDISAAIEVKGWRLRDIRILELSPWFSRLVLAHSQSPPNSLLKALQSRPPTLG
jgi:hypothetical protein